MKLKSLIAAVWITACTINCGDEPDLVAPGCYGPTQTPTAGSTHPDSSPPPLRAGAGASDTTRASGVTTSAATAGAPAAGASSAMSSTTPSNAAADGGTRPNCDVSGRWLFTTHTVTDAIGQLQYAHYYFYYDIEPNGASFKVRKGLICGTDAVGGGDFAVSVDFTSAWSPTMRRLTFDGQTVKSSATSDGCMIAFDKFYLVMGATLPYYLDPSHTLPTAGDKASVSTPGWEDWDNDGNPGITGVISGVVSGKVFAAPRNWLLMTGVVPNVRSSFELPVQWDAEPNVMAVDGSPLLASEAVRAADPKLHFVQFARLADDQAVGDDEAICKSIIALAPMLTPTAAGM